jgi:hypothetical protein
MWKTETSITRRNIRGSIAPGTGPLVPSAPSEAELLFTQFSGKIDWVAKPARTDLAGHGEQQL